MRTRGSSYRIEKRGAEVARVKQSSNLLNRSSRSSQRREKPETSGEEKTEAEKVINWAPKCWVEREMRLRDFVQKIEGWVKRTTGNNSFFHLFISGILFWKLKSLK